MAFDLGEFADRLRVAPCVDRHLADAQRRINAVAESGSTPPANSNLAGAGPAHPHWRI
jgi:hypothetical protein